MNAFEKSMGNVLHPLLDKYEVTELIGEGSYGIVMAGKERRSGGRAVAIKLVRQPLVDLSDATRMLRELSILSRIENENVIRLLDVVYAQTRGSSLLAALATTRDQNDNGMNRDSECLSTAFDSIASHRGSEVHDDAATVAAHHAISINVFLITELMEMDMARLLRHSQQLTADHVSLFGYQILRGLKFLHSANVVHRDLKPSNCLVNTANCDLKLCDLGASRVQPLSQMDMSALDNCSVLYYVAPEGLYAEGHYSMAVDVWAAGCLLAEFFMHRPLFVGGDSFDQLQVIAATIGPPPAAVVASVHEVYFNQLMQELASTAPTPDPSSKNNLYAQLPAAGAPDSAIQLITSMLSWSPVARPTAAQCLQHPFFHHLHDPTDEPSADKPIPALDVASDDSDVLGNRSSIVSRLFLELEKWGSLKQ